MAVAKLDDVDLYYEVQGKGKPIILCAGFTCDVSHWTTIQPHLIPHFQTIVYDNRGVGRTKYPDQPFSVDKMADDVVGLMDHLNLKKAHILGHSMGGAIAQSFAHRYPERVSRLIISNSLIKLIKTGYRHQKSILELKEAEIDRRLILQAILPWVFSNRFLAQDRLVEQVIKVGLNYPYQQTIHGFKRQLDALKHFDSTHWYSKITNPTLVIDSDEDILCPFDSRRIAAGIANAELYTFSQMGHLPMLEKPKEFSEVVMRFLSGNF